MQQSQAPDKFLIPFANGAGQSYVRTIPPGSQIGINPGAASLQDGFPPLNFTPVQSGGVPPFGQDINGILRQITQWSRWQAAGGLVLWDGTFASAIGGYPRGALLSSAVAGLAWLNTIDNNTTNPDGGTATGWQPMLTGASVPQTSLIHAGADTSTTPGAITIPTLSPPVSALGNFQVFEIVPALPIVGPTTVSVQNFGSVSLKRNDGADPRAGDGPAGQPFLAVFLNGVLRRLDHTASEIAGMVTSGTTITNYLTQQGYAPPGSSFAGQQQRFAYMPVQGQTSTLTASFTVQYSGTVTLFSTLNSSPDNGNISNTGIISVNGTPTSGAGDTIAGASISIVSLAVAKGASIVVSSNILPADQPPHNVSQYLTYEFNPG